MPKTFEWLWTVTCPTHGPRSAAQTATSHTSGAHTQIYDHPWPVTLAHNPQGARRAALPFSLTQVHKTDGYCRRCDAEGPLHLVRYYQPGPNTPTVCTDECVKAHGDTCNCPACHGACHGLGACVETNHPIVVTQ